jgi:ankyrin repeat protein
MRKNLRRDVGKRKRRHPFEPISPTRSLSELKHRDPDGRGSLHQAAIARDDAETIRRLIRLGLRIDSPDKVGNTPLILAALANRPVNVKTLLREGAQANLHNKAGESAITSASAWGYTQVVLELLNSGADIDNADRDGATALMLAANKGPLRLVKVLCDRGANPFSTDGRGHTVMEHALWSGKPRVQEIVKRAQSRWLIAAAKKSDRVRSKTRSPEKGKKRKKDIPKKKRKRK